MIFDSFEDITAHVQLSGLENLSAATKFLGVLENVVSHSECGCSSSTIPFGDSAHFDFGFDFGRVRPTGDGMGHDQFGRTTDALSLTSTSDGSSDEPIVIIATGFADPATVGSGGGRFEGRSFDRTAGTGDSGATDPNCANTNNITGVAAPDNATYYAPESVSQAYLVDALNHISSIYGNNPLNKIAVVDEIISMYTNPSNPFFIDFKDWGTAAGPPGSVSGGTVTYFSTAAGHNVTGSAFEAFGNFFFGVICTWGGLAPEEIWAAAAWYSESGPFWDGDDPQDIPHVDNGIAAAQSFLDGTRNSLFTLEITNCQSGGTS